MTPQRIQLRRTKGWRKPEGAIVVARPSRWGNPFKIGEPIPDSPNRMLGPVSGVEHATAEQVVEAYRHFITFVWVPVKPTARPHRGLYTYGAETIKQHAVRTLRGHDLACWCPLDQACHGDVLLEVANT